jgi:hypothetical protein
MYAYLNSDGQWLTVSDRHTHTGRHLDFGWSTDVNLAYVGNLTSEMRRQLEAQKIQLISVPAVATVVRTVKLGPPEMQTPYQGM